MSNRSRIRTGATLALFAVGVRGGSGSGVESTGNGIRKKTDP